MSRIDFVTGAPIKYAENVSQLSSIPNLVKKALREEKMGQSKDNAIDALSDEAEWSSHRVLCHMRNYSYNITLLIKRMLTDTDPKQIHWNENKEYTELKQSEKALLNIHSQLKGNIESLVIMLSETPDAAWGRAGTHLYLGRISVKQLVKWHYNHLLQHIEQIANIESN
ncbi:MAG: hypothetical protein P8J51_00535 [Dehalococcoidia bacterium]|jgi:hypothetical protein|nr:hypothetical protein [Dehalococcoidia bacterium]